MINYEFINTPEIYKNTENSPVHDERQQDLDTKNLGELEIISHMQWMNSAN